MDNRAKTIRSQISQGYKVIAAIILALVAVSIVYLYNIQLNFTVVTACRNNQADTQGAVISHYKWLDGLNISVMTGKEFTGSLDPTTCSLGKWMAGTSEEDLKDPQVSVALEAVRVPHQEIHKAAADLLESMKTDPDKAETHFTEMVEPQVKQVIAQLTAISDRYKVLSDEATAKLVRLILLSILTSIILAVVAMILAQLESKSVSQKISVPIARIVDWSEKLSVGTEILDFDGMDSDTGNSMEVHAMIRSFRKMAESIHDNANVVKRVAEGDMTAFVNIRSNGDSLGRNLYRMVQSNDHLFAEILQIARTVTEGATRISDSSTQLVKTSREQADDVGRLSSTIDMTNELIIQNSGQTRQAAKLSEKVRDNVNASNEKINLLIHSVAEIREASEQISSVIKSIKDIAFQINLLALNASVEAARAGAAGKGFAIVANEMRQLAIKSEESAKESRALIENTIGKTHEGSQNSQEASSIFTKMIDDINGILNIVIDVASASEKQMSGMDTVRRDISGITQTAKGYSSISQDFAEESSQMNQNAEILKQYMGKFTLRKREQGRPYIPPEKQKDTNFIREAEANYEKALREGLVQSGAIS